MVSEKYQLDPVMKLYDPTANTTFYTSYQIYSISGKFDNRFSFGRLVMPSELYFPFFFGMVKKEGGGNQRSKGVTIGALDLLYFNPKSAASSFGVTSFALMV